MGGGSSPDTSAQDALVAKQQKQLDEQKVQAELEAGRSRNQRINQQRARRSRRSGRASLIKTGTELGSTGELG